ncbi:NYN domain-containing protein [Pseudogemmobacter faecipullorum]|uniref:RNase NYN domain-containing protein n=1 Tax=Pseudogemmobacter faecipullorum TaxID=2755041 RepID=A0ABS8CNP6_9RHOB|nr:hypothetical protein [Pseudogemmobacter faecipullorum]MCB5410994.1 hypothetical protein [Pseudogemmobacter faecipullorum]
MAELAELWPLLLPAVLLGLILWLRHLWLSRPAPARRRRIRPSRRAGHGAPRRGKQPPAPRPGWRKGRRDLAVIDGSNLMYWRDNQPDLTPVRAAARACKAKGYKVGVIFDANAGYKLYNAYMPAHRLSAELGLPPDQVFVVPKGEQADPFLLDFASEEGGIILSNDRFRDRIAAYPKLNTPGRLVRGHWDQGEIHLNF